MALRPKLDEAKAMVARERGEADDGDGEQRGQVAERGLAREPRRGCRRSGIARDERRESAEQREARRHVAEVEDGDRPGCR